MIILEEVQDNVSTEVARFESGEIVIGREPDFGFQLDRDAISREHGRFVQFGSHWLFQDLGSTNGSWLNGEKLEPNHWNLLRETDYIQLADVALKVKFPDGPGAGGFPARQKSSLIVVGQNGFVEEFPIPDYGRALMVGGSSGDIEIPGDVAEEPALVIERRGENVCAFQVSKQYSFLRNGVEVAETVDVDDRDVLGISRFQIIVNSPPRAGGAAGAAPAGAASGADEGGLRGWGNDGSGPDLAAGAELGSSIDPGGRSAGIPFGQGAAEGRSDQTVMMDPDDMGTISGMDMHPSMRRILDDTTGNYSLRSFEDKFILTIGLILMMVLVFLALWWVFSAG
jgi:hypothetical protein